jgi:UDP-N-acetylmuramate--alanine ligase
MSRHVHLVGIGGTGLSAIARVLYERGEMVTGSDRTRSSFAEALEDLGIPISYEHRAENVLGANLVIASSAIPMNNVELQAAQAQGIPVLRRSAFLRDLTAGEKTIAVAGTHGKTTTTGLIAWMLSQAGLDPSFIVGGTLSNYDLNARAGTGDYFVIEADEYDRMFLGLEPSIAVVTNVEHDHPDCYPTFDSFRQAFAQFAASVQDLVIICKDDPAADSLPLPAIECVRYGLSADADWRAEEVRPNAVGGSDFLVLRREETLGLMRTRLPGPHNVLNTLAALVVGDHLGLDFKDMRESLTEFLGVGRRFEIIGEVAGVIIVDDYAHHPTEIKATLRGARQQYPDAEIWAVYQPHTFSRIRALLPDFSDAFEACDHVIVTDIFASREQADGSIDSRVLVENINHPDVKYIGRLEAAADYLLERVKGGSLVVTLSAGDGNRVGYRVLEGLKTEGGKDHV